MSEDRRACGVVHPLDNSIVCTLYDHERDHHRGWYDRDGELKPVHWGSAAGRYGRLGWWR